MRHRLLGELSREKVLVSPSVLASDFSCLGEEVKRVESGGCDMLHLDIMDGHFVPNLTFGPPLVSSIRKNSNLLFDTHLMLTNPLKYIKPFAEAGADSITFHVESENDPREVIAAIREQGCSVGISVKPGTPARALEQYIELVDMVLVMTVEPGFGGQSFMADMIPKVAEIFAMFREKNPEGFIEVDGGIDARTAPEIIRAGASVLVAGTAVFRAKEGAAEAIRVLHSYSGLLPAR